MKHLNSFLDLFPTIFLEWSVIFQYLKVLLSASESFEAVILTDRLRVQNSASYYIADLFEAKIMRFYNFLLIVHELLYEILGVFCWLLKMWMAIIHHTNSAERYPWFSFVFCGLVVTVVLRYSVDMRHKDRSWHLLAVFSNCWWQILRALH